MYIGAVLVVNPLGPSAARYYRDGESPGTWRAKGSSAIGLDGQVSPTALEHLLQARDPHSGVELFGRRHPHRRAGWDLIVAAPKSVSVLAGLAPPPRAEALVAAQQAAVDDALAWLEQRACWARRDGRLVAADGLIAARFDHHRSAAGDPHLHAHVVLANLARTPDGRWSSLDGSSLWLHRRAFSAIYDLALRHHLERCGLRAGWELHPDGTWDVASVPRAAIDSVSRREADVRRTLTDEETTRRSRRAARALTRPDEPRTVPGDHPSATTKSWWGAVTAAGLDPGAAAGISYPRAEPHWAEPPLTGSTSPREPLSSREPLSPREPLSWRPRASPEATAREHPVSTGPPPLDLAGSVGARLVSRRSDWTSRDVVVALAASAAFGVTPEAADRWARDFSRSCLPAPGGRLTSPAAGDLDRSVLDLARRAARGIGLAAPDALEAALYRRPDLDPTARAAVRRLTGAGHGVDLLGLPEASGTGGAGCEALVAQAAVLDAAREAWTASGQHVVVASTTAGTGRWAALAGLSGPAGSPGAGPETSLRAAGLRGLRAAGGRPASVLVVDRADRLSPEDLRDLLEEASLVPTKVVLVRGGTLPALHTATCRGLEAIDADLGHATPSQHPPGSLGGPDAPLGALSTGRALERITTLWDGPDAPHRLVGLGPAEVNELNRRARESLRSAGRLTGPDVILAGRPFAVGDLVIPLRREAGAPGSVGRVVGAEPGSARHPGRVVVDWGGSDRTHDAWSARHLGHGYALTPAGLRLRAGPALLLGQPAALGPSARWVELSLRAGGPDPGADLTPGPRRDLGIGTVPEHGPGRPARQPAAPERTPGTQPTPATPGSRRLVREVPDLGPGLGTGW